MEIKQINNEFEQTLIDNGYRFFKDNLKNSIRGIQKKYTDEKGVKYFITGYHYNFAKQFPHILDSTNTESLKKDKYTFESQFIKEKEGKAETVNVSFSAEFLPNSERPASSLKEVEDFFEKIFKDFGFNYYEVY